MEKQEKLVMRARFVASGILRYHKFNLLSVEELNQSVEILAEELASIRDCEVALKIRGDVERYGLKFPEPGSPGDSEVESETAAELDEVYSSSQPKEPKRMPFKYVRRANNQVSEQLETCIGELLSRGWKKSAIARALRVNRRVVIRVAREAQSAHKSAIVGG